MKLGILKSFKKMNIHLDSLVESCRYLNIEYAVIDLLADTWIEDIKAANIDGILVRVYGNYDVYKSLFDERLYIINDELGIPIYPSRKELYLYENKRLYAYWLASNNFPHPKTSVWYQKEDAINFLKETNYPIVFKTNGGACSSGVTIVKSYNQAKRYANKVFGLFDFRLSTGKVFMGNFKGLPIPKYAMAQKNYLITQEFLKIKWEWRIIKIGESYFGHQKLLKGDFASGSGLVGWVEPPVELLDMITDVCNKGDFDSMAMDVLETIDGDYYINEIQSLFGSNIDYQMKIDGVPGRFRCVEGSYVFEEGSFNTINSNILRVSDFVNKLNDNYYLKK